VRLSYKSSSSHDVCGSVVECSLLLQCVEITPLILDQYSDVDPDPHSFESLDPDPEV